MIKECSIWDPWKDHNWVPCFRERYLNSGLILCVVASSFIISIYQIIKHIQKNKEYVPLGKSSRSNTNNYGSVAVQEDESDTSFSTTVNPKTKLWSLFDWIRCILSIVQLYLVIKITLFTKNDDTIEEPIEGSRHDLLNIYYTRIIIWSYCSLYALCNICLSFLKKGKYISDLLCTHLNYLYIFDFVIQLMNLSSYYLVHDIDQISPRYQNWIISALITLLLIITFINESRQEPAEPIIADTGRVMSGETWASLYSKFMFSWVDPMLKMGNQKTLDPGDLFELIPKNRTKSTLNAYRLHKRAKMAYSLLLTFKKPLFIQFLYCMAWCVLMFGPPYFLNRIIKFIEHDNEQESLSSAYISVFMLFVTSCTNSLCYQQALYIGRSLGIQIQSIVIGEVYNKSLKRRDKCDTSSDLTDDKAKKANVNNLLSVDAQKLAEIVSYVFYVYCFPVQVTICIWSLYKLLGNASLWGVLIIFLSQPITYYLSRNFQRLQHQVLECTDKRISLMNELLSAIRIVKFFAWEKQFKTRVMDVRDTELKLVRARLMSYMWIGNVWFFIPAIIMVAVFYAYTLDHKLTASTAFTALALFNNFKTALDELPVVISFVLQSGVSLNRVESFLEEEEVQEPVSPINTSNTCIGFINNASFSWQAHGTAQIKQLNLSFPVNQMSIVCGPTGSGKTTLIMSLLGETYRLSGDVVLPRKKSSQGSGIAYVAQTAWLQNCSIRDNILYGLPYDEARYEKVLYMTALTRDLEILEFGDATEVGEKGITLSGGQKQRVAIARAVYSQADIVILDDCLSAVDAHTAKHLYQHCLIGEYMNNRTVILVTHHVGLCIPGASYVVALDESGSVAAAGTPLDVIRTGALGDEITEQTWQAKEEAALDGPIPTVPQRMKVKTVGGGKLVQEETREEGGVKWSVYGTYYYASGGFIFWGSVMILFCCAQASVVGQDYWIRVWSAAYDNMKDTTTYVAYASGVSTSLSILKQMIPTSVVQQVSERLSDENGVNVGYYLGIYFMIGMLTLALATLRSLVLFMGSLSASRRIHAQLLDSILRAKVRFFDTTPIGRIVNRFSSDLETIDQALAPSLSYLLYTSIAAIYVIILISVITPSFIVPGFIVALVFKYIGSYYLNTSRDMKRLNSVSRSPIYVHFNETVVGVSTIRAFGSQKRFIDVNYTHIDNNNRPFLWMWATNRWLHCRIECLGAFVGFLTGVVLLASRDWINAGLAGLSLSYALTFTHHILFVVRMYAINEMNMNAIERVHEYLVIDQEPPAHIPETSPRISWPEMGRLQVQDLVMQYAEDTPAVLRNVSFETKPREKIGIVGRTGSGKSTLALSLFRFMEPTSGRILIDGVDIHTMGLDDLRSRLTIIPQDPVLFSGTLRSNLDPFDQYDDATLWAALKRSHLIDDDSTAENVITLDSPVNENGSNWSQGQRQLIALARALVKKSSLIVLDEATSSVDFDTDQQIQETIRKEFDDSTLLCIAHRIRTIVDYDRILVLDHGEIKEFDTPYNLMTREDSIFHQMCKRTGEYNELLAISKAKSS